MSGKPALPNLHSVQTVNGTKTSASAPDKSLNKNVESLLSSSVRKLPSLGALPLKPVVQNSGYEDAPPPTTAAATKPLVQKTLSMNGHTTELKTTAIKSSDNKKKKSKRKSEKQTVDEDEDDDVSYDEKKDRKKTGKKEDLSSESDEEDEDEGDDEAEAESATTTEESGEGEDDDNEHEPIAKRIAEKDRKGRPKGKIVDGSMSVDGDDDDDDESMDMNELPEKEFLNTPAGKLLGVDVFRGIMERMKQRDSNLQMLPMRLVFSLNMFVKALLAVRCSQLVAQMFGSTAENEKENAAVLKSISTLMRNDPSKYTEQISFSDKSYQILAAATGFGIVRRLVVRGVDKKGFVICAMKLDPFKEGRYKTFSETVAKKIGCWNEKHILAPITSTRYALFEGNTALPPTIAEKREDDGQSMPPPSSISDSQSSVTPIAYIRPKMTPNGAVITASSRNLLMYNIGMELKNARAQMCIVPDNVLASLFEVLGEIREKKALANSKSLDGVPGNFAYFVARSVRPQTPEIVTDIDNGLTTFGTCFIANHEQMFVFAHLLFGFLRMQENLTELDADSGAFVFKRMQHELHDEVLGVTKTMKLTLGYNELPVNYVFAAKGKTLDLFTALWKEYLTKINCKPNCTSAEYCRAREVAASKNESINVARKYVLGGSSSQQIVVGAPSMEAQVKDMLDSIVRNIFVLV